uniref:Uncharacterized protein n=1 Tax=Ascaris lumbricoides TaxID=6252 RepID=A0A0M3HJ40_ASCLU
MQYFSEFSATTGENSLSQSDMLQIEKRLNKIAYETTFENEVEDASEEDAVDVSDEEDWSEGKKKRKKRGGASSGSSRGNARKSAGGSSNANAQLTPLPSTLPPDPKPFVCHREFLFTCFFFHLVSTYYMYSVVIC